MLVQKRDCTAFPLLQQHLKVLFNFASSMGDQGTILNPKHVQRLENQTYKVVGRHSAVKVCHWTKQAMKGVNACYKQKFYGIDCHQCMEMTPSVLWCNNNCGFCWRNMEHMTAKNIPSKDQVDEPRILIKNMIEARKTLLHGFGGNPNVDHAKWKESYVPTHFAISLSGEPTLYARLPEMIKILRDEYKARSIFLVTNGQNPAMLKQLEKQDALPTQLYISMNAADKETYVKTNRPIEKDYWDRFLKTLDICKSVKNKTRTVLRLTLLKGENMHNAEQYAALFKRADPTFIEIKGFAWLGWSRNRKERDAQPTHEDMRAFAQECISYWPDLNIIDEKVESSIVLLGTADIPDRMIAQREIDYEGFLKKEEEERQKQCAKISSLPIIQP